MYVLFLHNIDTGWVKTKDWDMRDHKERQIIIWHVTWDWLHIPNPENNTPQDENAKDSY